MPTNTYVELDKKTTIASVDSVTFTDIPSTYTDLVLVVNGANVSSDQGLACQVGTGTLDTAVNYSTIYMLGSGSTTGSSRITADPYAVVGRMGNANSTSIIQFLNYSNATTKKTILGRGNNGAYVIQHASMWQGTTAINTIKVFNLTSVNLAAGATFSLYGIKAQVAPGTAKATGGTITYDNFGYVYHTFTASGDFTPSVPLSCDYLIVAGGGAGGGTDGGGGGGGGYRYLTSQSLTSLTPITVGGGGTGAGAYSQGTSGINSSVGAISATGGGKGGGGSGPQVFGTAGGSGGGGAGNTGGGGGASGAGNAGSYSPVEGFAGGLGKATEGPRRGAGGGGAGGLGINGDSTSNGGVGSNSLSSWATATSTGVSGYYAGGGGGGVNGGSPGAGGAGGGSAGAIGAASGNATANTGGGSGGGGNDSGSGNGGSGIVIIRYQG
jgi:hypothetical protein